MDSSQETVAQDFLFMEFSKQEYFSGLLFPAPGDLPNPGIQPVSPASPALAGRFFTMPQTLLKQQPHPQYLLLPLT